MTDTNSAAGGDWSLTTRIAAAFTIIALLAVGLVVTLVVVTTTREASSLAGTERQRTADAAAALAADAYRRADGWAGAELGTARAALQGANGSLSILDARGNVITVAPGRQGGTAGSGVGAGRGTATGAHTASAEIRVGSRTVGTVVVRSAGSGLSRAEQRLRDRLVTVAVVSGALAALLALGAALLVARRLTAPLRRLTEVAGAVEQGEPGARAAVDDAPGEIGQLSRAFDRMAQALDDQAAQRNALLAEIAHELRTPLTILRGNCEALVDGVETPSPAKLASLHDEVLRLERLVTDLETLSASEATFLQLELTQVDLAAIVEKTASLLRGQAAEAGITVTTNLAPAIVRGDRARLTQIVENLVANALKFTPDGGAVTAEVYSRDGQAVVEVRDTGPGIPEGDLPHVFERFWRGRAASTVGGRGIGLAVVDELARAHGGAVSVASTLGKGSVFTVHIPLG